MRAYTIIWSLIGYVIPVTIFITLYSYILYRLKYSVKSMVDKTNSTGDTASKKAVSQITMTAITVTIIYTVSFSMDTICFLLAWLKIFPYYLQSPALLKIGSFLVTVNSCVNPYVYTLGMPAFRKYLLDILSCRGSSDNVGSEVSGKQTKYTESSNAQ